MTGDARWFLPSLFVCQLLAILLVRLPHWLQMGLAVALCVLIPTSGFVLAWKPFEFLPFLVAGMWIGGRRVHLLDRLAGWQAWAGFAVLATIQLGAIALFGPATPRTMTALGLWGTAMLALLCTGIGTGLLGKALAWCGEASLGIYLMAPYGQGVGRELLLRLAHTTAVWPQILLPTLVATLVPGLIWHARKRLRIAWLFSLPAMQQASDEGR